MSETKRSEHDAVELERVPSTPASELPKGNPAAPPPPAANPAPAIAPPRLEGFDPTFWDLIVA